MLMHEAQFVIGSKNGGYTDKVINMKDDEPFLPFDTIIAPEILSKRLPSKSDIGRCMCVSKQWRSFLSSPTFGRKHFQNHKVTIDDYKLLLIGDYTLPPSSSINDDRILLIDDSLPKSFPFSTFSLDQTLPPFISDLGLCLGLDLDLDSDSCPFRVPVSIKASLDGMVCLSVPSSDVPYNKLVIFNPLTRAYKTLPDLGMLAATSPIGFYFVNNDYKLVCLLSEGITGDAYVYSDRANSWRYVYFSVDLPHEPLWWCPPTLFGQSLYFVVRRFCRVLSFSRIIHFDMNTEEFTEMRAPPSRTVSLGDYHSACLVVLDECELRLYLSYETSDMKRGVDVWRLDDVAADAWVKVVSYKVEQQQEQHRICTASADNWLAVVDESDDSFKKMDREELKTRYRYFDSTAVTEYRFTRVIYAQTLVTPYGAKLLPYP